MISPDYPASEARWATIKFEPGQFLATPGALAALTGDDIATAIARHLCGDWGEVCEEDRAENERSLACGSRLMSVYDSAKAVRFWIITEADRSVTTVLLPSEY